MNSAKYTVHIYNFPFECMLITPFYVMVPCLESVLWSDPAVLPDAPRSRHHGGVLATGWTQLHPVFPDLCKSSEGCPEDRVQSERWEDFGQQHKNCESGEEGVAESDWSLKCWVLKVKHVGPCSGRWKSTSPPGGQAAHLVDKLTMPIN